MAILSMLTIKERRFDCSLVCRQWKHLGSAALANIHLRINVASGYIRAIRLSRGGIVNEQTRDPFTMIRSYIPWSQIQTLRLYVDRAWMPVGRIDTRSLFKRSASPPLAMVSPASLPSSVQPHPSAAAAAADAQSYSMPMLSTLVIDDDRTENDDWTDIRRMIQTSPQLCHIHLPQIRFVTSYSGVFEQFLMVRASQHMHASVNGTTSLMACGRCKRASMTVQCIDDVDCVVNAHRLCYSCFSQPQSFYSMLDDSIVDIDERIHIDMIDRVSINELPK